MIRAIRLRTQLGNEQNNIDAYMKHRNMTEIILGMRKHVEKLMAEPDQRDGGMKAFEHIKYKKVPPKQKLDPGFETALKTQVFNHQKLNIGKKNTHWAAWSISVQSYKVFKQLKRGAVFFMNPFSALLLFVLVGVCRS